MNCSPKLLTRRAEKHNQTLYGLMIIIGGLIGAAVGIAPWVAQREGIGVIMC